MDLHSWNQICSIPGLGEQIFRGDQIRYAVTPEPFYSN